MHDFNNCSHGRLIALPAADDLFSHLELVFFLNALLFCNRP